MKNCKIKIECISVILSAVLLIGFLLPSFQLSNIFDLGVSENVRTITANEIFNVSIEDEIELFLNQFDDYECIVDEDLEQVLVRETKCLDGAVTVYETYINYMANELRAFTVILRSYNEEGMLETEDCYAVQLYYETEEDEYYIVFGNEMISISELVGTDVLENCIAIADDIAVSVALLAVTAVIVCHPYIKTIVTTVVTTVVSWVKSLWRWLNGVFITKKVTTTTVEPVVYYRTNIFSRDFELERVEATDVACEVSRDAGGYYLAVVVGSIVYISIETITESEAVAVLASNIDVRIEETDFQLNTYTAGEMDAESIALQAANYNGLLEITRHTYHNRGGTKKGIYFEHYHPGPSYMHGLPHSFFGVPMIVV